MQNMENKKLTPIRAIRQYCFECSGYSKKEVKLCPIDDCPLYKFRMKGVNKNDNNKQT